MTEEEKLKKLLDDPRTGLRESSDTNKTRYAILALFEENSTQEKRELKKNKRNERGQFIAVLAFDQSIDKELEELK